MAAPRKAPENKHACRWISLPPDIRAYLDSLPIGMKSAAIVAAVEASPGFRAWHDRQEAK